MNIKTTFKFYAVENVPFIGAYRCGSFNEGEPQIMFAMDFATYTLKDEPKGNLSETFKDMMLQTLVHEFAHAMQEMLDKDYNELEVEKILGAYKPTWNVFEASDNDEMPEAVFAIEDFLEWLSTNKAQNTEDLKAEINDLFMAHKLWIDAERQSKEENLTPCPLSFREGKLS